MKKKKLKDLFTGYAFAAPSTLLLITFLIIPIFMVF